jgi:ABC-type dipeptide/oligopeptide/nickel transport system ATPase component
MHTESHVFPENVLTIRDLHTYFYTEDGVVKALNGVNLEIRRGEVLGLVGESGCGKSVTALSILRLIQDPRGNLV